MSEKYYLVTWDEIEDLRVASQLHGKFGKEEARGLIEARDKCKARPVPEWATHFALIEGQLTVLTAEIIR